MTRSKLYYQPKSRPNEDEIIDKLLDLYEAHPVYGYRRMTANLKLQGIIINSSYAREEKLDKIVTIDDYNSINKKLSGCTRL